MVSNYFLNACESGTCGDNQIPSVVSQPDAYTFGSAPRTVSGVRQPGGQNVSMSLFKEFPLGVVDHERDQYVCGAIHTQTIEGFWSLVKRGIMGSYHKVSSKYLPLYVAEFSFRYNNRENNDIFGTAIKAC